MNKNKSNMITSPKKQTFSWKIFIFAFIVAFFLNIFISIAVGVEPRKNIAWSVAWIYLSIEAWKSWKWKALLPYPLFLVLSIISQLILAATGSNYLSWTHISVGLFLNIGGLITFYLLLRRTQTQNNQNIVAGASQPVEYATEDQVVTNFSKTFPREKHSPIPLQKVVDEERIYDEIAKELENGVTNNGLWIRLFAECDGDERQTKVLYIKRRAERLIAAKRTDIEKMPQEAPRVIDKSYKKGEENYSSKKDYWATNESQLSKKLSHDRFSNELKRIERRTSARIRAICPSAFGSESDSKN